MTQHVTSAPDLRPGGLVTVAFLKARLDEGCDHLDIFAPLVLDVLGRFAFSSFATADVQEALAEKHGLAIPQETLSTLLKRATRKRLLIREAGRYRMAQTPITTSDLSAAKQGIEQAQCRFGQALKSHASKRGHILESAEAALDMLFRFLEAEQVSLLLGDSFDTNQRPGATVRERGIVAEFIHDNLRDDPAMGSVLRGMLEGLVIYHAAFLPELTSSTRQFQDLRAIFDAVLVRQAIGYEGTASQTLACETLKLLKGSGVQCLVLDKTIHEIQRILRMYEDKLATSEGRSSLKSVPMARHFLASRYGPSDVRERAALLEKDIVAAGFQILPAPPHEREYTSGEKALALRLADPKTKNELEPRVVHDVDCVAAALTLRKGHRASRLEEARAVFVTSSPLVIRNTRIWWDEDECETSVPPLVHVRALSNLAWLKKPSLCADYKVRELVALCAAAMRPSQETWSRFLRHLDSLRSSRRLDSDETVAIVVSSMSDRLLREAELEEEDPSDIDAATLDEVVERVKASYAAQGEQRIETLTSEFRCQLEAVRAERDSEVQRLSEEMNALADDRLKKLEESQARAREALSEAETRARDLAEEKARRDHVVRERARRWARWLTWSMRAVIGALVVAGAVSVLVSHPFHAGWLGAAIAGSVVVFVALELVGVLGHLERLLNTTEIRLTKHFRAWLTGSRGQDFGAGGRLPSILPPR